MFSRAANRLSVAARSRCTSTLGVRSLSVSRDVVAGGLAGISVVCTHL
jgi:hypothetical protein